MQVKSKSSDWFRRYNAVNAHVYSLCSVVTMKIRLRSPKSNQNFKPSSTLQYMKFGQNPSFDSRDRVQIHLFESKFEKCTVCIVWWPWKFWSRSPKSNQIFEPSQCYNIWSLARIRHLVQELEVLVKIYKISKCWCGFENEVKVIKSNHFLPLAIMRLCKFGQNPPIGWEIGCRQEATRTPTPTRLLSN